ncbi:MAG: ankyrin repeat domain-containing protein [Acidobacteriota bacterium]
MQTPPSADHEGQAIEDVGAGVETIEDSDADVEAIEDAVAGGEVIEDAETDVATNEVAVAEVGSDVSAADRCLNCETPRHGEFCSGCGQRFLADRLTLGSLWRHGVRQLFNLDQGLLRTMREMLTDPGGVARRYIGGARRSYLNPFTYLVVCSAISLLLHRSAERFGSLDVHDALPTSDLPPEFVRFNVALINWLTDNSAWTALVMSLPFAVLLRRFFRRTGIHLAETAVFSLFTLGQITLMSSLLFLPAFWLSADHYSYMIANRMSFVVAFVIGAQALMGFFGKGLAPVLKGLVALALSYVGFILSVALVITSIIFQDQSLREGVAPEPTLFLAAEANDLEMASTLLAEGADVDRVRVETALHLATTNGHMEMVELLVDRGADLQALDHQGYSVLHRAILQKRREVASFLIERGADVDRAQPDGTTPLMVAAGLSTRLTRTLLEAGAEVDAARDHRLATALMVAVADGDLSTVRALLKFGADPVITNRYSESALELARQAIHEPGSGSGRTAQSILEALESVNAP